MNKQTHITNKGASASKNAPAAGSILQRQCACGQHTIAGGECEECGKKRLQRRAETDEVPPVVHEVLRSPGQPLDAETRAFMEPRFHQDFSRVRVHTDARAVESTRAVNALAYTVGRDIVLGQRQYAPGTMEGRKLLAHELTHVVQQRKGVSAPLQFAGTTILRDASYEHEADAQSALVTDGKPATISLHGSATVDSGTVATKTIQLLEKPGASPASEGTGANAAQQEGSTQATDETGKPCLRFYLPVLTGGKVTWEGISQEMLDKHVRLKSEDYKVLLRATANSTDTCDAIYFGSAYGRFILKIPDHCTVTYKNSLSKWTSCCNLFGTGLAKIRGKDTAPRPGTATEFYVPNNWEPEKAPELEPVKPARETKQQSKGTAIPIKT